MIGVPPTIGFIGKWRLYETALQIHPLLLAAFALASIMALIAYTLALTHTWWGTPLDGSPPRREPLLLKGVILALVILVLASGVWPNLLAMFHGGRP
jgi:formate hydrogenlyase subunit 3/multisubunit Na+/H+ antiporter MnhD subunit